jgi:predicted alpha/beta superfamily hydrolase
MPTGRARAPSGAELHILRSDAIGDDFEISVFPPALPGDGPVPVVYCTDANFTAGMAADVVALLQRGMEIPPVRLVCIGYRLRSDDLAQVVSLRTRDFTATRDPDREARLSLMAGGIDVRGGGAEAFLEFMVRELRPWVTANYLVTDDSTYLGYSDAGLFGTYALFHRPSAFRRYVIGSPTLCWDREVSTAYEAAYAATHDDLDATVFLCAGSDEELLPPAMPDFVAQDLRGADTARLTRELGDVLAGRGFPALDLTTRIFPEQTHFTMPALLMAHGLRAVFAAEREGARATPP